MCIRSTLTFALLLLSGISRAQPFPPGSGFTWERVGDIPIYVFGLSIDTGGTLWVGADALYRLDVSDGLPGTWVEVTNDLLQHVWLVLPLGPAGALGRADTIVASVPDTYRSTDAGATWMTVSEFGPDLELIEVQDGPLAGWLLGVGGSTVIVSEDRGVTWREAEMQTGVGFNPLDDVIGLPSGRVLAGGPNGITVSDDAAHTFHPSSFWEYLRYGAFNFVLVERPEGGQRILAVTADQTRPNYRFHASDDDGETWFELGDIIDPDTGDSDSGIALLPLGGSKALLVLRSGLVQVTADAGATWEAVGRAPVYDSLSAYASAAVFDAEGRLYVGQVGRGANNGQWVWRTQEAVTVANEPTPTPQETGILLEVRPNPSVGAAEVIVALPEAADVRVVLYDALGRQVAVLHDGTLAAGRQVLPLDVWGLGLPAGVYVVRTEAQGSGEARHVSVTRFTVVR